MPRLKRLTFLRDTESGSVKINMCILR